MEAVKEAPKKAKKTKKGEEDDEEKDDEESDDKAREDGEKKEEDDDVKKSDAKKNSQNKEHKSNNNPDNQTLASPASDSSSYRDSDWDSDDEPVGNLTFPHLAEKLAISYQPSTRHHSDHHPRGISLSGLLNAIDGVASHEGRVLVMTTNKPEALDEALIRPGRVDLQVCFTNATRHQAKELFIRMYVDDTPKPVKQKDVNIDSDGRLISPADIQGYLLKRKKTPRRAAAEVDVWVKGLLEQKTKKTRVLAVQ